MARRRSHPHQAAQEQRDSRRVAIENDPEWLDTIQRRLPPADRTVLLDIAPPEAASRKQQHRDAFEQDLDLLGRVRASYLRQAAATPGWRVVDAARDRAEVSADVWRMVQALMNM